MHKISQSSQAWEGDAGAVQELDDVSLACVPERCRTGGQGRKTEGSADAALIRLFTSNKDSRTRRARGACDCQERIRQLLVVFTPGSSSD